MVFKLLKCKSIVKGSYKRYFYVILFNEWHSYMNNRKAASHFAPYVVTQFIVKTSSLTGKY